MRSVSPASRLGAFLMLPSREPSVFTKSTGGPCLSLKPANSISEPSGDHWSLPSTTGWSEMSQIELLQSSEEPGHIVIPSSPIRLRGAGVGEVVGLGVGTVASSGTSVADDSAVGAAVGSGVGTSVDSAVGAAVGSGVGASVDSAVGAAVGSGVGASVDSAVGAAVGSGVGASVDSAVGAAVGSGVGASVDSAVGAAVGSGVGASVDSAVGAAVGSGVGASVDSAVGAAVSSGVGASVGSEVGVAVGSTVDGAVSSTVGPAVCSALLPEFAAQPDTPARADTTSAPSTTHIHSTTHMRSINRVTSSPGYSAYIAMMSTNVTSTHTRIIDVTTLLFLGYVPNVIGGKSTPPQFRSDSGMEGRAPLVHNGAAPAYRRRSGAPASIFVPATVILRPLTWEAP